MAARDEVVLKLRSTVPVIRYLPLQRSARFLLIKVHVKLILRFSLFPQLLHLELLRSAIVYVIRLNYMPILYNIDIYVLKRFFLLLYDLVLYVVEWILSCLLTQHINKKRKKARLFSQPFFVLIPKYISQFLHNISFRLPVLSYAKLQC